MKDKIMKGKMTKRVLSFILTLAMVFSLMPGNVEKVKAADDVIKVGTLDELKSALGNEAIHRVIVSQTITLTDGTELDGNGKTVQVEVPYLEESGATSGSPSKYNVFTVASGANVTIKNMQIFGGMDRESSAGGIVNQGTLTLENITIARSYRGLCIANSSKAVLKNTNIVRNQCTYGGGILCAGGTLVMDGCSLTENRSTGSGKGGGAMEVNGGGKLYANNTVIANNSSSEIGGAINNYKSNVYLMNCQVIGNVTTRDVTYGGGLGINGGTLKAVNSIFKDNYFISGGTGTVEAGTLQVSDVGIYTGSGNELINCIYGKIQGSESAVTKKDCKVITEDNIFTSYRNDGVLYGSSNNYTTGFPHPALRAKDGNSYALYANPSSSEAAKDGGVDTYFDYSDLANVKMSYGPEASMTAMTTSQAGADRKVKTCYEGGERKSGVIGASAVSDERFYTVKLGGVPSGGTVQGISIYGDSYASGTSVTVSAIPDTGYEFTGWKKDGTIVSTDAKYTFSVTENLNLTAEFTKHTHSWNYMNGTGEEANKLYAFCSNGNDCPYAGSTGDVSKAVSLTLNVTSQIYSGNAVTASYGSGEAEAWKTATGSEPPKITYYRKNGEKETITTNDNSGADGTGNAPKYAGEYVAKVVVTADSNTYTAEKAFKIDPKSVTASVAVTNKSYDGTTAAEVTATVDTGITGQTLTITGLTGTFDNKNAGTGKTVTINSTNAQVTAGADTDASNYSITYPATATGDITAKTLNAVVSAADKVYDGTTTAEVTATVKTGIGEETLTITGLTGSFADQNVGTDKKVFIDSNGASVQAGAGTSAGNYTVVYPAASTASITARPVTLTWSSADLTYTGSEQEVTAEVSNKASGADSFTITYTNNKKTAVGAYTATVTDLGNSNYTLTGAEDTTKNWSISYLVTDAKAAPSGDTRNDSGWFTGTVTLTPDSGYWISKDGTKWSDTLTVIDDGESTVTYYLKGRNGSITDQKTVTIKKDSTAPGGKIKAGENSFKQFLNTITFGYFFKNTVDVEISGTDATSGIAKIEYQKVAKGETYNADGTWTAGKSFSMTANDKSVIYARITDVAGNTVIINSEGIVVYTDATTSDSVEYTRTTKTDVTSAIELKGNTVEEIRNGNTVLTEGTDYEIKDSRIVLKGEYLEKLSVGDYCLSVSYNPYGEVYGEDAHGIKVADSTIKVTVKRADSESADTKITNKDKLSKEYDGQQTEAAAPSSKNGSTPKVEYKKKGNPDSSFTEEVPKDAGNYVVRVTYPQDENYEETSVTEEFTISPKAVTAVVSVSTKIYNGTTDAEVTATVDTGITGQKLAITGLTGTFDNKNAGTGKTVTINSTNAQVTAGAGTKASNYRITYPAESTGSIQAASLTIKVNDASKHIGKADPAFGYSVITGILVEGDSISGIIFTRTAGETAGTYDITATEKVGSNPNYNITITDGTLTIEDHTLVTDAAIAATCTETGLTEGKHCSVCNEVLVAQKEVAAKGHTEVVDEAVEATCTETGLTEGKHCSVCNEVLVAQEEVAAKGHTEVVDEAVEATCTTAGKTAGKHCSVCNEVLVAQEEVAAKGHTEVVDEAVEATCTTAGKTAGKHCSVCEEVLVAQETVAALGHDWSGEWTIVKEATATTDGKRETICTRDGCGQKKYETIPATGTPEEPENPNAGKLDKDAEVEPDAQIDEATLDNKKSELLDAPAIFTEAEKQQIQSGTDARVWLDVKRTDESSIPAEDKKEVTKEAEKIMGENPMITYFDADLFKQVEGGDKTQIHEPGIDIQVTILIPDELLNHDRTMVREYKIIRLHYDAVTGESKVDVLSGDFDRGTGEFSFKTDKFSTFAIAYTDIQLVTGITLTADSATLTGSGETVQLTAIVAPDNAVNKNVIWTSSDPNVATVDANGKVAAVGNGTCTITATTEDGSFTAICTIKVEIPDSDNGGNNGDNNSGDNNQSNEDANTPANTKEDKKPNVEAPKTGDASNVTLWSLLLALSALALAGIRVARRKRSSSIEK